MKKNNIKIELNHRNDDWKYLGTLKYDIKDQKGSQLLRVEVYIHSDEGDFKIFSTNLKVEGPLPNGVSSAQYRSIISTLEDEKILMGIEEKFLAGIGEASLLGVEEEFFSKLEKEDYEIPTDYIILSGSDDHDISSSPEDSGYEEEIGEWLAEFLVEDGFMDRITTLIESVRNEPESPTTQKIVPDSREKSTDEAE